MLTLWDLIEPVIDRVKRRKPNGGTTLRSRAGAAAPSAPTAAAPSAPPRRPSRPPNGSKLNPAAPRPTMQDRYDAVARAMLAKYGVRVRRYRSAMSGIAWEVRYRDGTVRRLIEAPRPRGPMSAAVFLHEIGHHAIGFNTFKPRCLEEYHAWAFAIREMEIHNLNITDAVRRRMHESLHYAIAKARRRGLRDLPPELEPFARPAPKRRAPQGA